MVNAQRPMGDWSIGLTGSVEYFLRTLTDAERFSLDTNLFIGMTDEEYLEQRNLIDKPLFPGYSAGILLGYSINSRIELETGARFVEGGTKADVNAVTNFNMMNVFGIENTGEIVKNSYRIIEVPLILKHRLGTPNKHDLSSRKRGSSITNMYRHFFVSYGLGIGFPVNGNEFYNGVEYSRIQGNMGLAALASVGYHVNTRSPIYFNIRAHGRATFLSYYEYAPIKSYYHSVGAEIKIGYRFAYKGKSEGNSKGTDCTSFKDSPNNKSKSKFMFGMRYGVGVNFLKGNSASDPRIGLKGTVPATYDDVETATGETSTNYTPHIGVHLEYAFHPMFSIGVSPSYVQRGFESQHTYFLDDERTLKTRQRAYIGYAEIPIKFIYYPTQKYFAHAGAAISIYTDNRLYDYYQVYNGLGNFPSENINFRDEVSIKNYYSYDPDPFILGWEFGGGAHLDEHVAVSAQVGLYQQIFPEGNGREDFWNTTLQVSMYYYFYKK